MVEDQSHGWMVAQSLFVQAAVLLRSEAVSDSINNANKALPLELPDVVTSSDQWDDKLLFWGQMGATPAGQVSKRLVLAVQTRRLRQQMLWWGTSR